MATRLIETGSIDIEAIKDQHPLAEIVSQYVSLKRKKDILEGLCPFHDERTPSFKVYENDQHFYCFGCGAHGDIFDFLKHQEGLDIRGAAERITGGSYPTYTPERVEELRAKRARWEAEEAAKRESAIIAARERWIGADPNFLDHPYLERKRIQPHGVRLDGSDLLIPLMGEDGKIQTLQSIAPDGRKLFVSDAPVAGGLFVIGGKVVNATTPVLVCEGYATAASLYEATSYVTVCAFNAGNLGKVADRLRARYPGKDYIVAGDDDRHKNKNVGREAAIEAAAILKGRAIFPLFPPASDGTDFNDMAAAFGTDALKAFVINGVEPEGVAPPDPGETFQLLDLDELEALPPPTWLIDELVADHGLTIVYGEPGAGKSFVVLDMALRIAFGMPWHETAARQCGVLYIAGEGSRGLGKRVKGWRREHGLEGVSAPFLLLPVAVQLLDAAERQKLLKTISLAMHRAGFPIGVVIIDTVSRALAGQDENGQEAMTLFVSACSAVQDFTAGAVIGVHHSGKDASRGMRGSTVLLGACDASLRVTKKSEAGNEKRITIDVEKQKDAEEAAPIEMLLRKVEWATGLSKEESTLIPELATVVAPMPKRELSKAEADRIFQKIDYAWGQGSPWSNTPQSKRRGRYLPDILREEYQIEEKAGLDYIEGWLLRGYLGIEERDRRNKVSGLKVLRFLEPDQ